MIKEKAVMNFSVNSSMVMGSMCVQGVRGTRAEKAETKAIFNSDPGLVDRLFAVGKKEVM